MSVAGGGIDMISKRVIVRSDREDTNIMEHYLHICTRAVPCSLYLLKHLSECLLLHCKALIEH